MHYKLPAELAQKLANYLQTKPYMEVAGLIAELIKLEPASEPNPPPPQDPADA